MKYFVSTFNTPKHYNEQFFFDLAKGDIACFLLANILTLILKMLLTLFMLIEINKEEGVQICTFTLVAVTIYNFTNTF